MKASSNIYSKNTFFILGLCELLKEQSEGKDYCIIDSEVAHNLACGEFHDGFNKKIVFIRDDIDYYALQHITNAIFIDKKSDLKKILSCIFFEKAHCSYRVKYKLSHKENIILKLMLNGLTKNEIADSLNIKTKTVYTYQRNLIEKLQLKNRLYFYTGISRFSTQ